MKPGYAPIETESTTQTPYFAGEVRQYSPGASDWGGVVQPADTQRTELFAAPTLGAKDWTDALARFKDDGRFVPYLTDIRDMYEAGELMVIAHGYCWQIQSG